MDLDILLLVGTFIFIAIMKRHERRFGEYCPKCGAFNRVAMIKKHTPTVLLYIFLLWLRVFMRRTIFIFWAHFLFFVDGYILFCLRNSMFVNEAAL
ncbi:hypothetical protein [Desulfovibrio subterraneus]|uniref:hypothetical protein n=1 Tax=Desulfovibrio subterraneus TaxID=2718620 RepID=UPI00157B82ED|nr:hypothetical protein [Desulfovibrio subterraneus]